MSRRTPVLAGLTAVGPVLAGLLVAGGCGHHPASPRPITVKVMVLPEHSLNVLSSRVPPMVTYLQESLGSAYRVEWISCPSQEAFMATAERERPDVCLQDAYHAAWLMRLQQAEPILRVVAESGRTTTRGLVVVPIDSPIRTVSDLAGTRVAISSRRSHLGYIAQASLLEKEANIHPGSVRTVLVRWSDRVADAIEQGRADAGFIAEADLADGMRVLARTPEVPTACVVVFPHTSPAVADRVQEALARLEGRDPEDAQILHGLRIKGFSPVESSESAEIVRLAQNSPVPY